MSFVYPAIRDARRLLDAVELGQPEPGGAGCVNGTRLLDDRTVIAAALGFDDVIEHTRDAMWQIDGLIHVLATAASLLDAEQARGGPGDLVEHRVRLRGPRRRIHAAS